MTGRTPRTPAESPGTTSAERHATSEDAEFSASAEAPANSGLPTNTELPASPRPPASPAPLASPELPANPALPTSSEPPASPALFANSELRESHAEKQRLLAVDTLLADPEAIPDPLEVELYAYREQITGEIVG
jgi:hypothetical protein